MYLHFQIIICNKYFQLLVQGSQCNFTLPRFSKDQQLKLCLKKRPIQSDNWIKWDTNEMINKIDAESNGMNAVIYSLSKR